MLILGFSQTPVLLKMPTKIWQSRLKSAFHMAVFASAVFSAKPAFSAEFLAPLPVQNLTVGERYTLGIRPSRAVARRTLTSKIDLYAEGLSNGASFRMVGDEIWELTWFPSPLDGGMHSIRILVTERGRPTEVIETQELIFVVTPVRNQEPVTIVEPAPKPALTSTLDSTTNPTSPAVPASPLVSVDLDSPSADTILIVPASKLETTSELELESTSELEPSPEAEEISPTDAIEKPDWSLAKIASRVVTPHQWVRFPVELISESSAVSDYVAVQVDALPNGASFDTGSDGARQFQWRPGTADSGEHVFNFTAIDTNDAQRRQTVTMRIIVQE